MANCGTIDPDRQAQYERAAALWSDTYGGGDEGRRRWWDDGEAPRFLRELAAAVRRVAPDYGLPPSPTDLMIVGHAAYSSGWGRSVMTQLTHNAWGIKCGPSWTGPVLETASTEYDASTGGLRPDRARWRVFGSWDEAIRLYLDKVMHEDRYRGAAAALRAGSLDYMRELGRGGWYTQPPAKSDAIWRGAMKRAAPIIGVQPLRSAAAAEAAIGAILIAMLELFK